MVSLVKFWLRWHCAPPIEAAGAFRCRSFQQLSKHPAVGAKINILADAHQRPAYQPRLLKHEFYEIAITEFVSIHADFLETWTAKVEHLGGLSALQQSLNLRTDERIFEKIALIKLKLFLREELPRFAAGVSAGPAIEVYFHGFISSFSIHT
jgi:hypothetical protein